MVDINAAPADFLVGFPGVQRVGPDDIVIAVGSGTCPSDNQEGIAGALYVLGILIMLVLLIFVHLKKGFGVLHFVLHQRHIFSDSK